MIKESVMLFKLIKNLHSELIPFIQMIETTGANLSGDAVEQIDIAYACRETVSLLEDIRKVISKLQATSEANAATTVELVKKIGNIPSRTQYCTASVKPRVWFKVPYKRTEDNKEEYDQIMEKLINLPLSEDLIRPNAPGIADYCTKLIGEGREPIIKDITSTENGLTMRKLREVDE